MSAVIDIVTGVIGGIGDAALKIRTALTGVDPTKQAEVTELLANLEAQAQKAQTDLNLAEATNPSKFVSWWRPAVGWICVMAFALNFVVEPVFQWVLNVVQLKVTLPELDLATMLPVLLWMLGLGGYRTWEKIQGVSK